MNENRCSQVLRQPLNTSPHKGTISSFFFRKRPRRKSSLLLDQFGDKANFEGHFSDKENIIADSDRGSHAYFAGKFNKGRIDTDENKNITFANKNNRTRKSTTPSYGNGFAFELPDFESSDEESTSSFDENDFQETDTHEQEQNLSSEQHGHSKITVKLRNSDDAESHDKAFFVSQPNVQTTCLIDSITGQDSSKNFHLSEDQDQERHDGFIPTPNVHHRSSNIVQLLSPYEGVAPCEDEENEWSETKRSASSHRVKMNLGLGRDEIPSADIISGRKRTPYRDDESMHSTSKQQLTTSFSRNTIDLTLDERTNVKLSTITPHSTGGEDQMRKNNASTSHFFQNKKPPCSPALSGGEYSLIQFADSSPQFTVASSTDAENLIADNCDDDNSFEDLDCTELEVHMGLRKSPFDSKKIFGHQSNTKQIAFAGATTFNKSMISSYSPARLQKKKGACQWELVDDGVQEFSDDDKHDSKHRIETNRSTKRRRHCSINAAVTEEGRNSLPQALNQGKEIECIDISSENDEETPAIRSSIVPKPAASMTRTVKPPPSFGPVFVARNDLFGGSGCGINALRIQQPESESYDIGNAQSIGTNSHQRTQSSTTRTSSFQGGKAKRKAPTRRTASSTKNKTNNWGGRHGGQKGWNKGGNKRYNNKRAYKRGTGARAASSTKAWSNQGREVQSNNFRRYPKSEHETKFRVKMKVER